MKTKDEIIEIQEKFINWAKMVLNKNRLLVKMDGKRVYLHDN